MFESEVLEKIGLAFLSGVIAGQSLEESKCEDNKEDAEDVNVKTGVVKLDGEKAKDFMEFIKKLTGEEKE